MLKTPGWNSLKSAQEHNSILKTSPSLELKYLVNPTPEEVVVEFPHKVVMHFLCHVTGSVRDLLALKHDKAFLAYLSACSTAANSSYELPDEAIYLANAFQIAGFPHIIGTMWEAKDIGATALAGLFYKHFSLSVKDMSSYEDEHDVVAYALHDALQELCKDSKL
nr:hypothetical protein B0A51_00906 [Rachicladosporium sp. CCFEE 5018]